MVNSCQFEPPVIIQSLFNRLLRFANDTFENEAPLSCDHELELSIPKTVTQTEPISKADKLGTTKHLILAIVIIDFYTLVC